MVSSHAFDAWKNPGNVKTTVIIGLGVLALFFFNFLFRRSRAGQRLHAWLESFERFGQHFVRITIAVAILFSAQSLSFLGPELHLSLFPHMHVVQVALYLIGVMIALGVLTELAALTGIIIFIWSFFVYGGYVVTYLNYLGELIALLLFGLRAFSLDRFLFGPLKRFENFRKYESAIIRIFYGAALLYAAVTVKLLHPELTIEVVKNWNLTQFHWLFPSDPLLVTLGAALAEAAIGIFIILGFELRLTVLISLFYITLSLLYFRELVWPHLLLYGISFNLLVSPERFSLDSILFKKREGTKAVEGELPARANI